MDQKENCPKCGAPLGEIVTTATGRKLQRCTKGSWNTQTKQTEGCPFVKWHTIEPETLDEKCPKCKAPLLLQVTRFGKKMKKCSAGTWDKTTKQTTGCDYVEWINGTTEKLDESCPDCGEHLVLFTTNAGKRLKKCSTAGWDRATRSPTGCKYVEWLKKEFVVSDSGDEEHLPPEETN
jgi:ssDNA-binding Zn-finger/Zn-ribbon topoisomerase 1